MQCFEIIPPPLQKIIFFPILVPFLNECFFMLTCITALKFAVAGGFRGKSPPPERIFMGNLPPKLSNLVPE